MCPFATPLLPDDAALAQHALDHHLQRHSVENSTVWLGLSQADGGWRWSQIQGAYARSKGALDAASWASELGDSCRQADGSDALAPEVEALFERGCAVLQTGCCERVGDSNWLVWDPDARAMVSIRELAWFPPGCLPG